MDLSQVLDEQFHCGHCHAAGEWLRIAKPVLRKNSIIHRLQCAQCGARIVAKLSRSDNLRDDHDPQAHLRQEYETLCELQRLFPSDREYGTLVPLGYVESAGCGIMITAFFYGDDLLRYMRTLDASGVIKACHAAGIWLRKLHDGGSFGMQKRALNVEDKLSYLTASYGSVLQRNSRMLAAYRCLEKESARIGVSALDAVRQHGDFKPENMLCDGVRYVGLDVHWQIPGPAVYDLAPFLNHLWLAGRSLGSLSNRYYQQSEAAFLAGYGYVGEMRVLRWVQLYFALCQLGGYHKRGRFVASYASWKMWPLVRQITGKLSQVTLPAHDI